MVKKAKSFVSVCRCVGAASMKRQWNAELLIAAIAYVISTSERMAAMWRNKYVR